MFFKKINSKTKSYITIYFGSIFLITLIGILCLSIPDDSSMIVFFMISGFPVFIVLTILFSHQFSKLVKQQIPEFYNENVESLGPYKGTTLSSSVIYNDNKEIINSEFELIRIYPPLIKRIHTLLILSFVLIIPLSVGLVYFKR